MLRRQLDNKDWKAASLHIVAVSGAVLIVSIRPFCLDKSVLAAFVQVYVMLIIFAMGAPELLLNSVGREGVRQLIQETFRFPRSGRFLLLFLGFGAVTSTTYEAFPESIVGDRWVLARAIVVTLVASLSATLLSVLFYVRNFKLENMIGHIGRRARHCLEAPLPIDSQDRTGFDTEELRNSLNRALRSLEQLGAAGRIHVEWEKVLKELGHLATGVTESDRYGGASLESVIRSVVVVIKGNSRFTKAKDMIKGLDTMEAIQRSIRESRGSRTVDEARVQEALFNVSSFVLDVAIDNPGGGYEGVVERAISDLEDQPARQFVLLCKTLELGDSPLRQTAARRLKTYVKDECDLERRAVRRSRLLGYSALLREQGRAERRWVDEQVVASLDVDLAPVLDEAYEWMFKAGELAVASALDRWREEVVGEEEGSGSAGGCSSLVTLNLSLFGGS